MSLERLHLGIAWFLKVKVAKTEDPDVPLVVVLDMGTLIPEFATLPDPAGAVDDEVVADVGPSLALVAHPNEFEARCA